MARIAGIVVIIIIAIIVNFVLKRIPNDSNIKRFIRKWGRIITNVATTVITILTFIFPWISSPIFDEDTEEYYDEPSYSEVVTTSSTTNKTTTASTTKTTTTTTNNTTTTEPPYRKKR